MTFAGWAYAPFMRTTNDAIAHLVQITVAGDIASSKVAMLTTHLVQNGASSSWCSLDMCEAVFEHGLDAHELRRIAAHDDVLFVAKAYDLQLHNNLAATEVGAVAIRATSSLGLDGSGEQSLSWILDWITTIQMSSVVSLQSTHNTGSILPLLTATADTGPTLS